MPLIVRDATPADVPAIAALYADEVRDHVNTYEYDVPDDAEMARRMRGVLDAGYPYLVAERDGEFVGYAYASSYRARAGYRKTVENSVYVAHDSHRRGVGKALLQALIEACTEKGFRLMVAVIGDSKQAASIGLHEAAGFEHAGIFKNIGYKFDRWLDSVQMQRALGAGATKPP